MRSCANMQRKSRYVFFSEVKCVEWKWHRKMEHIFCVKQPCCSSRYSVLYVTEEMGVRAVSAQCIYFQIHSLCPYLPPSIRVFYLLPPFRCCCIAEFQVLTAVLLKIPTFLVVTPWGLSLRKQSLGRTKRRSLYINLHGVTSRMTGIWIIIALVTAFLLTMTQKLWRGKSQFAGVLNLQNYRQYFKWRNRLRRIYHGILYFQTFIWFHGIRINVILRTPVRTARPYLRLFRYLFPKCTQIGQ